MAEKLEMPLERFAEAVANDHERLRKEVEAWKGIHEGAVLAMQTEIDRLKKKCDFQAMILQRLTPEKFPDILFISGVLGERDHNNMPAKLMVVPAYGVDFSYIYERTEKTVGPEW